MYGQLLCGGIMRHRSLIRELRGDIFRRKLAEITNDNHTSCGVAQEIAQVMQWERTMAGVRTSIASALGGYCWRRFYE